MLTLPTDRLPENPFDRLRTLLDGVSPPRDLAPFVLSVGEPRHPPPDLVDTVIARHRGAWGRYPPVEGTADLRAAAARWLVRRYGLAPAMVDPDRHVLAVAGTREALFLAALAVLGSRDKGGRTVVALPNPFYHVYLGAALMSGGSPALLPATRETGFLPDLLAPPAAFWERVALLYLCSPANPQGAVADLAYLEHAIGLARRFGFVLAADECYGDIYGAAPPPGALEAAARLGGGWGNLLVFHSLSKRSSVPGLRSGFVAGDQALIARFRKLRAFSAATLPLPLQAASAALWDDDAHVSAARSLYARKFDLAEALLSGRFGFYRPPGGFFLWLDVGDGEAAARVLWSRAALRVLPGAYISRPEADGGDPGRAFIRVALIDDEGATEEALRRLAAVL